MSVFSSIKNWFKRTFGGGSSGSKVSRARTVSNYGGGGSRSYKSYADGGYTQRASAESEEERMKRLQRERQKKQEQITKNLSSITDAKSAGKVASSTMNSISGMERVTQKISERAKATPPDPKQKAAEQSRKRAVAQLKRIDNATQNVEKKLNDLNERIVKQAEEDRKSFNKATNDRYNVEKNGQQARIAQKMQAFDPDAAKWSIERHPIAESAARGALSGVTFGTSELAMRYLPRSEESREVEDFYQKHKSKGAELAGEVVGSLAGFGTTADLSANAMKRLAPKTISKVGARGAESLASKQLIRRAAEREAIKRFGAEGATKEIIDQIAKRRAGEVMASIGRDLAINTTTGAVMDVSHATMNSDNAADFAKNMAISAGLNTAIGGAATLAPALIAGRRMSSSEIARLASAARNNADDVAEAVARNADEVVRPPAIDEAVRPQAAEEAVRPQTVEAATKNSDSVLGRSESVPHRQNIEAGEASYGGLPIKYEPNMNAEASNMGAEIRVSSKFFNYDEAVQRHILNHEVSHGWSDEMMAEHAGDWQEFASNFIKEKALPPTSQAYQNGQRTYWEGLYGDIGATSLSESVTRAITEYLDDPIALARRSPEAYEAVKEFVERKMGRINVADDVVETVARNADEAVRPPAKAPAKATPPKAETARTVSEGTTPEATRSTANAVEDDFPYAMSDDEIPVDNIQQTRINDTRAEAEAQARRVMQEEPTGNTAAVKQTAEEAAEATEETVSQGQKEIREAYAKQTGEDFVPDGKRASFEDKWEALRKYEKSQGQSTERKLSKAASSQVRVSSKENAKVIDNLINSSHDLEYDVLHHRETYEEVAKNLEEDWDRWIDRLSDIAENGKWEGSETPKLLATAQFLSEITNASESPESAALANTAFKAIKTLASSSGQTLNLRRSFVALTESAKMENAIDDLVKILDPARGFNARHRKALRGLNKFEREHYIKSQLMKDSKIMDCVKKLVNAKNTEEVGDAYAELFFEFNKHHPKSGFDTIQEIRYLNMLGNPKTHIRNIFGSAFFSPMRQASSQVRSLIEDSIAKNAGLEITKHGGISLEAMSEAGRKAPKTEAGKKALEAFERVKSDLLSGAKYETPMYKGRSKTIAGKTLDKLSDFNSNLLAGEDNFFKERAFRENYIKSYNKYVKNKVPITEKLERQIEAEAMQEARIATFNEYNEFAKWLANITNKAYDANASAGARLGGTALNAVMPFTKVPTNIANQSLNYSPIGIARGFAGIKNAAKKGDAAALNKAIDQLASGLTGTAVFGMGMLLGKTSDAFTTNAGKNDEAAKFKKRQGVQNYSVTFTDPTSGEKYSATLDWLVPTSATFFSGVEMGNQMKKGDLDLLGLGMDWSQVMSRLAEPVLESSMLSGLYNMLESTREGYGGDDTKSALSIMLRELAQSYANSLVPTVAGQTARTLYKTDKQVGGDTDWEYFRNSMKQKTGLAADNAVTRKLGIEPLGADTDAYGNVKGEKKETSDYVKSALKNFISPANIQKVDLSEIDEKKIKQYEDAVKKGEDPTEMAYLFPKKQYKKQFSVGDMNVEMSNKDLSTYNQAKTKGGEEGMRLVLENIMFNRYGEDSNGDKVLKDGYTKEQKQKLMNQFKGKSLREVEEWLYKQPQFKKASEAEKKRAINGLWNLSGQGKSQGAKRVGEQAVIKAQGGDVDEYNFKNELSDKKQQALQPFIDNGILTYAEAVDFARNAGKTYYYENEDGGSSSTYFNKKQMIEYLQSKGYSYEKAEALFNAFKAGNAKPYDGSSSSSGYRRRGYRRRGYRRGGGGYSKKAKVPAPKKISASSFTKGQALVSKTSSSKSSSSKSTVPELKRVKAKIDLPTPKK